MFQPHHLNSHLQSERDLLDKLAGIRRTATLDEVANPASPKLEKVLSVEGQHRDPAPIADDGNRPFGRWYLTILAVVTFGAAVAALSYSFELSQKTLATVANR